MGRDKAFVAVGGRPLVMVAAEALAAAGAGEVAAIGGDGAALAALGLTAVPDDHPGEGPLGGILTALRWSPADVLMVLSCDLVAIGAEEVGTVVRALAAAQGADAAAPLLAGRAQYLTAAYRRRAAGRLQARFDAGERAVRRAVTDSGLTVVTPAGFDPARLRDADTPADLLVQAPQAPRRDGGDPRRGACRDTFS